ncbi:unnamed protein product [Spirodela intermedia]|uniref:Uncharacterized protein n=2 Tax=Spirodela intermedia TaxID=51605 RepID=A0A7I8IXW6_SPIIN|nr:unnamed protein product [Spirodela intermedia]CAA6662649.1 unnamed protein product [Spirodela intermedia]CAA7399058.1 unnamed protein product [Spirodela intermedia]
MDSAGEGTERGERKLSACDVEALKRCLQENKGDHRKCQTQVDAFKVSCSSKKPSSPQKQSR